MKSKNLYVTSCGNCLFREYNYEQGASFYYCTEISGYNGIINNINKVNDNCPLKRGGISIKIKLEEDKQ